MNRASPDRALWTFEGERAESLVQALDQAWTELSAVMAVTPLSLRRTKCNVLWELGWKALSSGFSLLDGVRELELPGPLYLWEVDGEWALRLKAHDQDYSTRNVNTRQQRRLRNWDLLPGLGRMTVIEVGPCPDPAWASADRLIMTRHVGPRLEWSLDLRALAAGSTQPVEIPRLPFDTPGAAGVKIVRRRSRPAAGRSETTS